MSPFCGWISVIRGEKTGRRLLITEKRSEVIFFSRSLLLNVQLINSVSNL